MPGAANIKGIPYQPGSFGIGPSSLSYSAISLGHTFGNVFFVDSGSGVDDIGTSGKSPDTPFASMDYATGQCTANNGDVVYVLPGHTESVTAAGGLDLDVAGVTYIGMGHGDVRPTIDFTTVVGADMDVDAADIIMFNFLFTGGIDALTGPIDVNSDDFALIGCEYRDVTGQATDVVIITGDRCTMDGWKHAGSASAGGESGIQLTGADYYTLRNFWMDGNFGTAAIEGVTTANTNITIHDGYIRTRNADDIAFTGVSTDTGQIGPNIYIRLQDDASNITEAIGVSTDLHFFDPIYVVNADTQRGLQWNQTASAD